MLGYSLVLMSYFEIKTIKGNDYLYLRQSIRIGNKVIHKNIGYFGRVDKASRISTGETITQVKERVIEPKKEPVKPEPKKIRIPLPPPAKTGREKKEEAKKKLLRRKKKRLKKFLRKKKLKDIPRDESGRFVPVIPES